MGDSDSEHSVDETGKPFTVYERKKYTKQWNSKLRLDEARKIYHEWFKDDPTWASMSKKDICDTFVEHNWAYYDSVEAINEILTGAGSQGKAGKQKRRNASEDEGDTDRPKKRSRSGKGPDRAGANSTPIPDSKEELALYIEELVEKRVTEKLKKADELKKQMSLLTEELAEQIPKTISLPKLKDEERIELLKGVPKYKEIPQVSKGDPAQVSKKIKNPETQKMVTKTIPQLQRMELDVYRYLTYMRNATQKGTMLTTSDIDERLEKVSKLVFDNCRHLLYLQKQLTGRALGHTEIADLRDDRQDNAFWQEEDTKALQDAEKLRRDVNYATGNRGGKNGQRGRGGRGNRFKRRFYQQNGNRQFRQPWQSDFHNRNRGNNFNSNSNNSQFDANRSSRGGRGRGRD